MIDWDIVRETLPAFWGGLQITLLLLLISTASGLILSVPLSMARASRRAWLWMPVLLYTYVIRGTPLLVQLFILYYGLPQFDADPRQRALAAVPHRPGSAPGWPSRSTPPPTRPRSSRARSRPRLRARSRRPAPWA